MKKSDTVLLLISLVSLLSSYFIIGEYRIGYFGYFLFSLTLLIGVLGINYYSCLLYTSPSPRDRTRPRMPSSA